MSDTELRTVYRTIELQNLTLTVGIIVSPRFPATRSEPAEGGLHGIESVHFGDDTTDATNITELIDDKVLHTLEWMAYEAYLHE